MAHVVPRVMVHETVLAWHERNAERERDAQAFAEVIENEFAAANYTYVDSD